MNQFYITRKGESTYFIQTVILKSFHYVDKGRGNELATYSDIPTTYIIANNYMNPFNECKVACSVLNFLLTATRQTNIGIDTDACVIYDTVFLLFSSINCFV